MYQFICITSVLFLHMHEYYIHLLEKQLVKQETQSAIEQRTNQTQSSTKEKTQQSDLEYNLFMQYHSKLTRIPSLIDLTSYFVAAKIITSSDAEAVANTIIMESQTAALRKLLNKISLTLLLGHGDSKLFDKMLKVMQIYGDDAVQHLATDMLETIIKQRSAVPITSGMQLRIIIIYMCMCVIRICSCLIGVSATIYS